MRKSTVYVALTLGLVACGQQASPSGSTVQESRAPAPEPQDQNFSRVSDRSLVCMVNDRYMGTPQIPVQVEGRTYFGCCEGCKKRLNEDPTVRRATDPISKNKVDKALAVIAKDAAGNVLYFENEQSLARANRAQ